MNNTNEAVLREADQNALNDAAWKFIENAPRDGIPAVLWNNLKAALWPAIDCYLAATATVAKPLIDLRNVTNIDRSSDMSVRVSFASARAASQFGNEVGANVGCTVAATTLGLQLDVPMTSQAVYWYTKGAASSSATVAKDGGSFQRATVADVEAWIERHGLGRTLKADGNGREAFDDAATLHMITLKPEASAEQPAGECNLSNAELADPEFVRGYIESCNDSCAQAVAECNRLRTIIALAAPISEDTGKAPERSGKTADYRDCCDTPHLCSAVRRCTAKDSAPADSSSAAPSDERIAFEAWVRKEYRVPDYIKIEKTAAFNANAWEGWQARAALAAPAPTGESLSEPADLWMHEDMARDATDAVVNLPRKELQAAYKQAREDLAYWKRRALTNAPTVPGEPT